MERIYVCGMGCLSLVSRRVIRKMVSRIAFVVLIAFFYVQTYAHYVIDVAVKPSVTWDGDGDVGWEGRIEYDLCWLDD